MRSERPPVGRVLPMPEARLLGRPVAADILHAASGVVDENVEAAEAGEREVDRARAIVVAHDIGHQRRDARLAERQLGFARDGLDFVPSPARR